MKKGISLLLALSCVLALFLSTPVLAAGFTDVDDSKYYADAIKWAVDQKITNGIGNNQFGVNGNVTRAQAVTFLWRASGSPSPKGTAETFEDVEESSWYELAVEWAVENKITDGVGDNKFNPDGPVTRGQMITFLYRAKGQPGENREGDQWYSAAERWAQSKGLLTGTAQAYTTNGECPRCDVVYYLWKEVRATTSNSGNSNNSGSQSTSKYPTDPEDGYTPTYTHNPAYDNGRGGSYDAWIDQLYERNGGRYSKAQLRSVNLDVASGQPGRWTGNEGDWSQGGN